MAPHFMKLRRKVANQNLHFCKEETVLLKRISLKRDEYYIYMALFTIPLKFVSFYYFQVFLPSVLLLIDYIVITLYIILFSLKKCFSLSFIVIANVNANYPKSAIVALIFLKQILEVSPSNKESSLYFTSKCSFDLRYLNGGVKTFVRTLAAGENPLGRIIY